MNLTEAAKYADAFAAVEAGAATAAQLAEASAVQISLSAYLRDTGDKIDRQSKARAAYLETLPEEKRAAVIAAVDGNAEAEPRIVFDRETGGAMTPKAIADREAAKVALRAEPGDAGV